MKKLIFVILLASLLLLSGCYDIGFGHNNNKHHGGDISQTYELQADGSWKGTEDGTILKGTNAAYIAELDKAPSAGGQPSNVKSISSNYEYTNTSGAAKMVIIRTTGGDLTINAPLDTVLHYGEAGTVNVIAVASSSYDGYAAITQKLVAKAGHIKLFDLITAAIPLIEVPADATVYRDRIRSVNEFERQLRDGGYILVKLFLRIDRDEQEKRLKALRENYATEWRVTEDDLWQHREFKRFREAYEEFMEETGKTVPWHVLDGEIKRSAVRDALKLLTKAIRKGLEEGRTAAPGARRGFLSERGGGL